MMQELLCLKCQQTEGRYHCPLCGFWYCFRHCAPEVHGCPWDETPWYLPVVPPPGKSLPEVFNYQLWNCLLAALKSAGTLYLTKPEVSRCLVFAVSSPASYIAIDIDASKSSPSMTEKAARSPEALVFAMPELTREFLVELLEYLAEHPYDATVPPPYREAKGALPGTPSLPSIQVKRVNLSDDMEGGAR